MPQMLKTSEVAERLRCSQSHLESLRARKPELSPPFIRIGRTVRFPADRLEAWIDAQLPGGGE